MALHRFPHSSREECFEFSRENRAELDRVLAKYPVKKSALIPALQLAQRQEGCITSAAMRHIADIFGISPMEVWGVVSFYTMLKTSPVGVHHFQVCTNLSCALLGSAALLGWLEKRLGCKACKSTDDGKFSIEKVECLGACGGAPCVQINDDYFERMTPEILERVVSAIERGEYVPPMGADEVALTPEQAAAGEGPETGEAP